MYHIVNDKRALTSARLIYQALVKCLDRKPFHKITVQDIQNESGVGRATFYRHFDSLSDVLQYEVDMYCAELRAIMCKREEQGGFPLEEYLHISLGYWMHHDEIVEGLASIDRMDILFEGMRKSNLELVSHVFPELGTDSKEYQMISHLRYGFLSGIVSMWLAGDKKDTPEELVRIIQSDVCQYYIRVVMGAELKSPVPPAYGGGAEQK